MKILGVNSYHANSSAALIIDGSVSYAIEEERINRIKNSGGFPINSIISCLKYKSLKLDDIDFVAVNTDPKFFMFKKLQFGLKNIFRPFQLIQKFKGFSNKMNIKKEINSLSNLGNFSGKILNIEHHLSHISSAYFQSGFESACGVSIDGSGDFTTTSNAICSDKNINIYNRICYPHSLGILYTAITHYLGFLNYGDEYKVMGMAAYGQNTFREKIKNLAYLNEDGTFKLNLKYFIHHKKFNTFSTENKKIINHNLLNEKSFFDLLKIKKRLPSEKIKQEHFDLANSLQFLYEELFFKYLNLSSKLSDTKNLCLAGGCAMNSLANGKIREKTNFERIFIQPASYDAGGALGAALYVASKLEKKRINKYYDNFYFGDSFENTDIFKTISDKEKIFNKEKIYYKKMNDQKEIIKDLVILLSQKKIVGIFKGRMEWGARALGNRSILADPRGDLIKDILNHKIKKRESFRPFAPMIIQEKLKEWFSVDFQLPTMMEVYKINNDKKNIVPSAVHKDQTCRIQTVNKKNNDFIYDLLKSFDDLTGVPMLLNTSFNENEPIVHTPENAIDTFLRTKMDALLLEDYLILRN